MSQKPKLTLKDIMVLTAKSSPYFFTRDTLRFFGQTLRSFKVIYAPDGKVYIVARTRRWMGSLQDFWTIREYSKGELNLVDDKALICAYLKDQYIKARGV